MSIRWLQERADRGELRVSSPPRALRGRRRQLRRWSDVLAIASRGNVVFTERVDHLTVAGKEVALPVAGVFEVRDGKIAAWRDYFDMGSYQRQVGGGAP